MVTKTKIKQENLSNDEQDSSSSDESETQTRQNNTIVKKTSPENKKISNKPKITKHHEAIEQYLEDRPTIKLLTIDQEEVQQILTKSELNDNDENEIWLLQCPQSFNVENLLNQKLKLNGKTRKIECKTQQKYEYKSELLLKTKTDDSIAENCGEYRTVILNSSTKLEPIIFKPTGLLKIQEECSSERVDGLIDLTDANQQVPYPENLKIRHPIHGFDFQSKTELPKQIKNRLNAAIQQSLTANVVVKKEKKLFQQESDQDMFALTQNDENEMIPPTQPVVRKKKRTISATNSSPTKNGSTKSPKKVKKEEPDTDLNWMTKI